MVVVVLLLLRTGRPGGSAVPAEALWPGEAEDEVVLPEGRDAPGISGERVAKPAPTGQSRAAAPAAISTGGPAVAVGVVAAPIAIASTVVVGFFVLVLVVLVVVLLVVVATRFSKKVHVVVVVVLVIVLVVVLVVVLVDVVDVVDVVVVLVDVVVVLVGYSPRSKLHWEE